MTTPKLLTTNRFIISYHVLVNGLSSFDVKVGINLSMAKPKTTKYVDENHHLHDIGKQLSCYKSGARIKRLVG